MEDIRIELPKCDSRKVIEPLPSWDASASTIVEPGWHQRHSSSDGMDKCRIGFWFWPRPHLELRSDFTSRFPYLIKVEGHSFFFIKLLPYKSTCPSVSNHTWHRHERGMIYLQKNVSAKSKKFSSTFLKSDNLKLRSVLEVTDRDQLGVMARTILHTRLFIHLLIYGKSRNPNP